MAQKHVVRNMLGQSYECDARLPDSIMFSHCERLDVTIHNKLASITLYECKDVVLSFPSVISVCEIIKVDNCAVFCTGACPTFTVDNSSDCTLHFPASPEDKTHFVLALSDHITCCAWPIGSRMTQDTQDAMTTVLPSCPRELGPGESVKQVSIQWDGHRFQPAKELLRGQGGIAVL